MLPPKISFKQRLLENNISRLEEMVFIFFVSMLCATVYLSSDVFLPAIPQVSHYFGSTPKTTQFTVSLFVITLASSQILNGLLADRFGKRTMLLWMLPIFLISTLGCIFSYNITFLIIMRIFQAFTASACIVIGRSIFSDIFEQKRAQKAFAILVPLVSLSPALGPGIGGIIISHFNWQASFVFVFLFTLIIYFWVLLYLPESLSVEKRLSQIKFKQVLSDITAMLTNTRYMQASLALSVGTCAWWVYVAGAPLMFHNSGLSVQTIGFLYLPAVLPYILFAFIARQMLRARLSDTIAHSGAILLFIVGIVLTFIAALSLSSFYHVIVAILFITASNGLIVSMSMASAISEFRHKSGTATGLIGTVQLLSGALGAALVQVWANTFQLSTFVTIECAVILVGCAAYAIVYYIRRSKLTAS